MAPIPNGRVIFNEVPTGFPEPGKTLVYDTSQTIDPENVTLSTGSVLIKVLYLSVDPYMRGRMRAPEVQSYSPPFPLGEPISGRGVGVIVRSENVDFNVGNHVVGFLEFSHYIVRENPSGTGLVVLNNKEKLPLSVYIGALGGPGKTAYYGWKEYANAKQREVAFVSTGAGATGSFVIQLAKRDGLKVIASAGSDKKVQLLKDLGADVAFNYKTTSTEEVLKKEGPIDIYWDNVGGSTLDAALGNAVHYARFIECGMISGYNKSDEPVEFRNVFQIIGRRIQIFGLIVTDLESKYTKEFSTLVPQLIKNGEIKYREDRTIGLDKAGEALLDVFNGNNIGKKVVVVAEE